MSLSFIYHKLYLIIYSISYFTVVEHFKAAVLALLLCFCSSFCSHNSLSPDRLTFGGIRKRNKIFLAVADWLFITHINEEIASNQVKNSYSFKRDSFGNVLSSFNTLTKAWTRTCLSLFVLYFHHKTCWIFISGDSLRFLLFIYFSC